ncbi:nitrogen fixation protein NifM [Billgrantia endophytica]|uniref:peptidylprolyl isomerase n=1 Tax=Billgrantia endophytica TaxID=2033802 RepID=A0A2N7U046_9GAMM|nr:nitrogen fixation protein NifM [Halomonas endophytica]PMR73809.1 nitrogen fixation protein NifM [Halomonas endophytica]
MGNERRQAGPGGSPYHLLKVAHERFERAPGDLDEQQLRQAQRIAARQLQIEEAVLHSPEALGVVIPSSQVDDAWTRLGNRYQDANVLRQALAACGLDQARMKEALARELKVEAVLARVCAGLPEVDDAEAGRYYHDHPEQFTRPASRQARHILVTINASYPENTREVALARIEAIANDLYREPKRFADQALRHSECPTSLQGGQLGNVKPGTLYPELEACLFEMAQGQISPVIESPLGFHLLYCEAALPAMLLPLDKVLTPLREKLQAHRRKVHQRQWLESLLQRTPRKENQAHG